MFHPFVFRGRPKFVFNFASVSVFFSIELVTGAVVV